MDQDFSRDSFFKEVPSAPDDPIFGIAALFNTDPRPIKVNLTVGYLASPEGSQPLILDSVRDAIREITETEVTKNYLPISGDKAYVEATRAYIFGDLAANRTLGFGVTGGTSALRMIAEFVFDHVTKNVCFSSPTWPNHTQIFKRVGFEVSQYPYEIEQTIDFNKVVDHLSLQPMGSMILLQPMCHNPTGYDFTSDEWKILSNLCKERRFLPLFDSAYQGLGVGFREDVDPICRFINDGHEVMVTHSFSKSMGLYGERVGAAFVVMSSQGPLKNVEGQMKAIIRTQYSNPPKHGEAIAHLILTNPERRMLWEKEVHGMRNRVDHYRQKLAKSLAEVSGKDCFYISAGHGFFCRLGLLKKQVIQLREEHGVYMTDSSRINLAAFNDKNFEIVMKALKVVV